ncbi:MAG: tRNA lysidine(34) synthetase TilS [Turicibacter sp.]|nr:tRNA lysidine(34) synthetase TilS [Turicibacter sp.]
MQKVILETIKKYNLFEKNISIIVAVSGGADSMALLHFMKGYAKKKQLQLIVAHVNHKKRENSELDEVLVEQVARNYNLPYEVYYLPKAENIENFHAYAREKRYEFFKSVAQDYQASCLVTAHHADDHLETQIHRFLYQNSPSGLIGIEPLTVNDGLKIVRPLIEVTKQKIYEYCINEEILFREDESNESNIYTRNRIRKYIVSELVKESPTIYEHARMISEQLREDEAYFSEQVDQLMSHVFLSKGTLEVSRSFFQTLHPSLMRRLIKRILQSFTFKDIQTIHIETIQELIKNPKPNLMMTLPHQISCIIAYDRVQFTILPVLDYEYERVLSFNKQTFLPDGSVIEMSKNKVDEKTENSCINKVHLCYNEIELPLKVRTRKPGDRIQLMHNYGSKKVKEIMIEQKIPRLLRDSWPIVTDANDQIIWIPLLKKSAYCHRQVKGHVITIDYCHHGGNENDA